MPSVADVEASNPAVSRLMHMASKIVASYVASNEVAANELPDLIERVHRALSQAAEGQKISDAPRPRPVVSIKDSITPEYIICLDDGKRLKLLKRHLRTVYNMTPDEYRLKWGLPFDYPMVAPKYAASRSALAKKIGLGRQAIGRQGVRRTQN